MQEILALIFMRSEDDPVSADRPPLLPTESCPKTCHVSYASG